jgi:hypothetical protein
MRALAGENSILERLKLSGSTLRLCQVGEGKKRI